MQQMDRCNKLFYGTNVGMFIFEIIYAFKELIAFNVAH